MTEKTRVAGPAKIVRGQGGVYLMIHGVPLSDTDERDNWGVLGLEELCDQINAGFQTQTARLQALEAVAGEMAHILKTFHCCMASKDVCCDVREVLESYAKLTSPEGRP